MTYPTPNRRLLVATALLALTAASEVAPAQKHPLTAVVIARCGPTDIVLNQQLVNALLLEPGVARNLTTTFDHEFRGIESVSVEIPASHGPGTFQLHIWCELTMTGSWDDKKRKKATTAIVKHLRSRLDDMLYESPLMQLSERRDRLRQQHLNLSANLLEVSAQIDHANHLQTVANKQLEEIREQLLAARLAVATEKHVREHLAKSREQNVDMRDILRKSNQKARREHEVLTQGLNDLVQDRAKARDRDSAKELTAKINRLSGQLDQIFDGITQRTELAADLQNMLTVILEQLPTSELTLQRAQARLASLLETVAELEARQVRAVKGAAKNSKLAVKAAHMQIDSQVTREQLLELEAQLSRIRPVRYEVLHPN